MSDKPEVDQRLLEVGKLWLPIDLLNEPVMM